MVRIEEHNQEFLKLKRNVVFLLKFEQVLNLNFDISNVIQPKQCFRVRSETAGKTHKKLNAFKKRLAQLTSDSTWLGEDIAERKATLMKTEADILKTADEKKRQRTLNKRLYVFSFFPPMQVLVEKMFSRFQSVCNFALAISGRCRTE